MRSAHSLVLVCFPLVCSTVSALSPSPAADQQSEVYEEPESILPTPTPPSSQENSGSGAVYARTSVLQPVPSSEAEVAHQWEYDLTGPKETKMKVSDIKGVVQKGYLEKLGGRSQTSWQKRYCVQAGPLMYFYEKESSKSYNNRIVLPSYIVNVANEHSNTKKKQFAFKLSHTDVTGKQKDYVFRAQSESDRQKWIQSIRDICEKAASVVAVRQSVTLPRVMPSQQQQAQRPVIAQRETRAASVADMTEEVYEDIQPEEEGGLDEYVDVVPVNDGPEEEYVDVVPAQKEGDDLPQEEYEDASAFQAPPPLPIRPPPPSAPPPPSSPLPLSVSPPIVAPPPPVHPPPPSHSPEPLVDTQKVYVQRQNGIKYENVFVILWDFSACERDELNLKRGDLVYVAEPQETSDWWYGEPLNEDASGKMDAPGGLFPRTYTSSAFEMTS